MKKLINPSVIILLAIILRLVPHIPNFAPITAIALFGGVYLGKRYALLLPLIIMVISDYLLLYFNPFSPTLFHFSHVYAPQLLITNTTLAVYGSFLISGGIGLWLRNHKSPSTVLFATFLASMQFFLITNAAVWVTGAYDRSLTGLWESYLAGIPFYRGTFFGDFFYTIVLFGGYELLNHYLMKKKIRVAT